MKGLAFNEQMVRAWLEGRKTVTRRLVKVNPYYNAKASHVERTVGWFDFEAPNGNRDRIRSKYIPGETVYIKETWAPSSFGGAVTDFIFYKATPNEGKFLLEDMRTWVREQTQAEYIGPWKSPRFMPESASRSHAMIVSVRPERVQEISREDAHNEGFWPGMNGLESWNGKSYGNAQLAFCACWETLYPGTWDQNPWVWRIELEQK